MRKKKVTEWAKMNFHFCKSAAMTRGLYAFLVRDNLCLQQWGQRGLCQARIKIK